MEKDEHKKSKEYKKLNPKMRKLWTIYLKKWTLNLQIS